MAKEIQFILYNLPDNSGTVQAYVENETLWLTQKAISQLFGVDRTVITKHLKNIFETGELYEESVCAKFAHTATDGKKYNTAFYSLDAIISVGYRVNSRRATLFRQWATRILNEYIRKGFVLEDERLKQGNATFGRDYFRELIERVRSIRASERRIWQQITDIYAECSIDYDRMAPATKDFYAMVQNRFHYAITGHTAAEIIHSGADHTKPHMGLTSWKNAPDGRILKSDVTIAKNYLTDKEIRSLERTVTSYFDYIEGQIERGNIFTMEQFAESVNKFLTFNDYKTLPNRGSISASQAKAKAEAEYDLFNPTQQIDSDFDKEIRRILDT
ncbi:virulence RhuM family protein [Paramuribaculum intestinale]|uniref:virulence RhuM family protein n=1 Tax=Paramuribaculum intestinale TaxID=2094151 RepID=UPI0025B67B82|nr:virulence RhuM family protein [Paramuribaculum intestinale]